MASRIHGADAQQYEPRSSEQLRSTLLTLTREFIQDAVSLPGVLRIACLGSLMTPKSRPKDTDLLVVISDDTPVGPLARLGRRLKGRAQSQLNSGADIFLVNERDKYRGRICPYRECHPRVLCQARHCGAIPHLADDLDLVALSRELVAGPPLEVYPAIVARASVPEDVTRLLIEPLQMSPQRRQG